MAYSAQLYFRRDRNMNRLLRITAVITVLLGAGCAQYENTRGVEVGWQANVSAGMAPGKTTRQQVLQQLGPPSQVVALGDETALYYLFERSAGNGLILILYNRFTVDTRYDRAIFFFDDQDLLTDFATHTADREG